MYMCYDILLNFYNTNHTVKLYNNTEYSQTG